MKQNQIQKQNRSKNLPAQRSAGGIWRHEQVGFSGATLVEILMSLMIIGVGLVMVATLFPISMLRSIQATQLTNAVLLKYQCEEYVQALPELGQNDYDSTHPVYDQTVLGYEQEVDRVLGNVEFTHRSKVWNRHAITTIPELKSILPLNVVTAVDPIGAFYNQSNPGNENTFGKDPHRLHKDPHGLHGLLPNMYYTVDRKNGGFNLGNIAQKNLAFSMFASNDSWKTFLSSLEVTGGGGGTTTVTLADTNSVDIAEFAASISSGAVIGRVVLIDSSGKQSHLSNVSSVAGQDVTFSSPLPDNGLFNGISEARLELFEPNYSCMITMRKQLVSLGVDGQPGIANKDDDNSDGDDDVSTGFDGSGEIGWPNSDDIVRILGGDLVVFFKRDFTPLAEQVYGVENLNKGQVGVQPQEVHLRWSSANADAKPRIRQGGYVFDTRNGYWYQIRTVITEDRNILVADRGRSAWIDAGNDREAIIVLDRSPEATGQYLMVPENVVEVFNFTAF